MDAGYYNNKGYIFIGDPKIRINDLASNLEPEKAYELLKDIGFKVEVNGKSLTVSCPPVGKVKRIIENGKLVLKMSEMPSGNNTLVRYNNKEASNGFVQKYDTRIEKVNSDKFNTNRTFVSSPSINTNIGTQYRGRDTIQSYVGSAVSRIAYLNHVMFEVEKEVILPYASTDKYTKSDGSIDDKLYREDQKDLLKYFIEDLVCEKEKLRDGAHIKKLVVHWLKDFLLVIEVFYGLVNSNPGKSTSYPSTGESRIVYSVMRQKIKIYEIKIIMRADENSYNNIKNIVEYFNISPQLLYFVRPH